MAKVKNKKVRLSDIEFIKADVLGYLGEACAKVGEQAEDDIITVVEGLCEIPEYSCVISIKETDDYKAFIDKWVAKFYNGKNSRSTVRVSNVIGTMHDDVLNTIIQSKLSDLSDEQIQSIKYAHRLCMAAENIAGSLLEEYLSTEIDKYNWFPCWGETFKSIDFVNKDGSLLQVKNSDNSENSSSNKVRVGTEIKHWARRLSKTGNTNWDSLNDMLGITNDDEKLSEAKYNAFVKQAITANPNSLSIEEGNSWANIKREVSKIG